MIAKMFNPTAKLVIPTGTQTNEENTEIETEPVTVETKGSFQHNLNTYTSFYTFHLLNHVLFLLKNNFLFHQFFLIQTRDLLLLP